jgi:hypothetical protein
MEGRKWPAGLALATPAVSGDHSIFERTAANFKVAKLDKLCLNITYFNMESQGTI